MSLRTAAADSLSAALQVPDAEAARFIANCVGDPQQRHTASQLLDDPFLQVRAAVTLLLHNTMAM
jgi:hypothetical protein